jgi:hypothetical protein
MIISPASSAWDSSSILRHWAEGYVRQRQDLVGAVIAGDAPRQEEFDL